MDEISDEDNINITIKKQEDQSAVLNVIRETMAAEFPIPTNKLAQISCLSVKRYFYTRKILMKLRTEPTQMSYSLLGFQVRFLKTDEQKTTLLSKQHRNSSKV